MVSQVELMTAQVAQIASCHPNTVKLYEKKGVIKAKRDRNGYRKYSLAQALKLREILSRRTPERAV